MNLKNKLYLIRYYESNKRKFIKYYKNGVLQNKLENIFLES